MEETNVRSPFDDADADIIIRSADRVDFRLYKNILKKASEVFRDMFTLPDAVDEGQPQVVELTEDADTLERLFRLCYPVEFPVFKTCDEIFPVLDAAQKYAISSVVAFARRALRDRAEKESPLRAYAIACRYEFPALARKAARLLVKEPDHMALRSLPPEIAALPHASLSLARYRSACRQAVVDELAHISEWRYIGGHKSQWEPCAWRDRYEAIATVALLKGGLDGGVMVQTHILADALRDDPQCKTCNLRTTCVALMNNASALKTRIEEAIDGVSLELPFIARDNPKSPV